MTSYIVRGILKYAICSLALTIVAACQNLPHKIDETLAWSNNKLYTEAQAALMGNAWDKCVKYFELLVGRNPFDYFAPQAQISIAYCHWKDGEVVAANDAVDRFTRLYPNHSYVAYAYYLKGIIHFNEDLGFFGHFFDQDISERDPKSLYESFNAFKIVAERYPSSKYAPDAARRMRYLVNALALHEIHVADYYYRRGAYVAAISRAQFAIKQYRNVPIIEDALHIIILSYQKLNEPQLADDAKRVLIATFPNSRYIIGIHTRPTKVQPWWQF